MDVGRIVKIAETVPPPLDIFINGIAFFLDIDGIPAVHGIHFHPVYADRVMLHVGCRLNDFRAASVQDETREKQDGKGHRDDANLAYGPAAMRLLIDFFVFAIFLLYLTNQITNQLCIFNPLKLNMQEKG